jgi:pyruvate,water dikinase
MDLIVSLEDVRARHVASAGAKAASLGELTAAGFLVPPGFVVTAAVYRAGRGVSVPANVMSLLANAYGRLGRRVGEPEPAVAVRSSAVGEGEHAPSQAGVYTSVTSVRGVSAIARAVERCWMSVESDSAVAYRALCGMEDVPVMAVIVQAMVPAVTGGVIFSVDPTGRDSNVAVVEASFGETRAVASGLVEPDTYVVARDSGHLLAVRLGSKALEVVAGPQGETTIAVDPARQRTRALDRSEVTEIARVALAAERHMGGPQDVEWCYDSTPNLFVLQARPIRIPARPRSGTVARGAVMAIGAGASPGIATGWARVLTSADQAGKVGAGDVLVVSNPGADWLQVLDRAAAVVTDRGGITGHLAAACRDVGVPCVVRTRTATIAIRDGDLVSVDGSAGTVRAARSNADVTGAHR